MSERDIRGLEERLRAGLEGVTPGPWRLDVPDRGYCMNYVATDATGFERDPNGYRRDIIADCDDCQRGEANAAHIANCSPENIAALLDANASLRSKVEELEREPDLSVILRLARLESDIRAAEAKVERLTEETRALIKAWEHLPEGHHAIQTIGFWLAEVMRPAIDKARALSEVKP